MEIPLCIYANACFIAPPNKDIFFIKMARSMLRGIKVESKDEMKARLLKYI
jgi:hypothetical protein